MLFVGDDWAEDHHDVEIVDENGKVLTRRRLPEGLDGITRLHGLIAEQIPQEWPDQEPVEAASLVKMGIETDRGPWVAALVAAGYEVSRSTRCRWPLPGTALHLGREVRCRRCASIGPDRAAGPGTPVVGGHRHGAQTDSGDVQPTQRDVFIR